MNNSMKKRVFAVLSLCIALFMVHTSEAVDCGKRPDLCKIFIVDVLDGVGRNYRCVEEDSTCFSELVIIADPIQ